MNQLIQIHRMAANLCYEIDKLPPSDEHKSIEALAHSIRQSIYKLISDDSK